MKTQRMMLAALLILSPLTSLAAVNVEGLLSQFSNTDANRSCSVSYNNGLIKIENSRARNHAFLRKVNTAKQLSDGNVMLVGSDYDGTATVYLTKQDGGLMVTATWQDDDNGFDDSAFCFLEGK